MFSTFNLFTKAIAMVKQGRLGKIKRMTAALGGAPTKPKIPVAEVPKELDWDRWLGPAPLVDYLSDVHSHMRMLNICHLTGIAARLGRGIKWDEKTEQIVGDEVANSTCKRQSREGYEIEIKTPEPAATNS